MDGINLAPLLDALVQVLALIIVLGAPVFVPWFVYRYMKNASAQTKATISARVIQLADAAATFTEQHANSEIAKIGPMSTGNEKIDAFGNFMIMQGPQLLADAGIKATPQIVAQDAVDTITRLAMARMTAPQIAAVSPTK